MDAEAWNRRYATDELIWHAEPNRFLPPEVDGLPPGRALDLACGEGRNAVWLAEQGWEVLGVDFADRAVAKAVRRAEDAGVADRCRFECADVTTWTSPTSADLVLVFYLQLPAAERAAVLGHAARALAAGGTVLVVAHDRSNLERGHGGPQDPTVLPTPAAIVDDLLAVDAGLVVQRAEVVERPVTVDGEDLVALDCLVRARRAG